MTALIIAAALIVLFGAGIAAGEKKRNAVFSGQIRAGYGKMSAAGHSAEELKRIAFYHKNRIKKEHTVNVIDDITWNDLEMNRIFDSMDRTYSSAGEEYLYHMLRTPSSDERELQERETVVRCFADNPEMREKLQLEFARIGKSSRISLYEYLLKLSSIGGHDRLIYRLPVTMLVLSTAWAVIMPGIGIIVMVGVIFLNIFLYYFWDSGELKPYLEAIGYVRRAVGSLGRISRYLTGELEPYGSRFSANYDRVRRLFRGSGILSTSSGSKSPGDALLDYVRVVTHLDVVKFYRMAGDLRKCGDDIEVLLDTIGFLESMIAVSSYRSALSYCCVPEFCDSACEKAALSVEDGYHPLIKNPVANSIRADRGVLITGSNASGKSTFLKTAALCAVMAQTIHTCPARAYRGNLYRICTSMALRDDLAAKESYYIVEIKSLKRILEYISGGPPVLCFIDEVLRGTNTIERIAASAQILKSLARPNVICAAATHDIELSKMLENCYDNYHFQEKLVNGDIEFDYHLYKGPSNSRNAIRLLEIIGYDRRITEKAELCAEHFLATGEWCL